METVTKIICHTQTTQTIASSATPNAVSLLMEIAGGFGFDFRLGNKAVTFEGPLDKAEALKRSARCLGLEILPGSAPGEVVKAIVQHRSIVRQLNTAAGQQRQYQQAASALRGRQC
jgi:hypothetical protein